MTMEGIMHRVNAIVNVCLILLIAGCAVGPNYQRPDIASPQAFRFAGTSPQDAVNAEWWRQFQDPVLTELVEIALRENRDLLIATARVDEYLGRLGIATGKLFPEIGATGTAQRQRATERGATAVPQNRATFWTFDAGFTASWEIDLWGKLRRSREAAKADLLGTEEARQGVIMTLVTSVANGYINLRSLDQQLEIAKTTTQMWAETYELFKLKFEGGVISEVDLMQVKSEYEAARATVPQIERTIVQQENALNLLLGRNPGPVKRGKTLDQLAFPVIPAGLPSELLERRPDIRQAEQELIAANARIGVAKAAYFPAITLTGFLGNASTQLSQLFTGPARMWTWAGQAALPIFAGGQIVSGVQVAEAQQLQALYNYQKTIQSAFSDVENALVTHVKTREQSEAQRLQVEALKTYAELSRLQYDEGFTSYLQVLDAERSYFSAQLSLTQTKGAIFQSIANLYKAMGGGWITEADRLATVKPPAADPDQNRQGE
jgi:multidrug efflux system outer membrane protein